MATVILDVDDKKLRFFKEMIRHFSFVTIQETSLDGDTDEYVIESVREGVREMRLVEQGKAKSTPFDEFLTELDEI